MIIKDCHVYECKYYMMIEVEWLVIAYHVLKQKSELCI